MPTTTEPVVLGGTDADQRALRRLLGSLLTRPSMGHRIMIPRMHSENGIQTLVCTYVYDNIHGNPVWRIGNGQTNENEEAIETVRRFLRESNQPATGETP